MRSPILAAKVYTTPARGWPGASRHRRGTTVGHGPRARLSAAHPGGDRTEHDEPITCVDTRYNRRAFNDGYHIGHHVKASRHWTEMPDDFVKNVETCAKEGAIVFRGVDFFQVWLYLMLGRFDWLADRYVELDGKGRTKQEIIDLLVTRSRPIREAKAGSPRPSDLKVPRP